MDNLFLFFNISFIIVSGNLTAYIILIVAVVLGTASNGFAKGAQGFTLLIPSTITAVTIVDVCLLYHLL